MIGKNNIANIRYSQYNNWVGQTGEEEGFCDFDSQDDCLRALVLILHSFMFKHGDRYLSDFIERYAPPSENNTQLYIAQVSEWNGWGNPHYILPSDIPNLVTGICRKETGTLIDIDQATNIFNNNWK